ncbi:MAG: hypothetical protein ACYTF8_00870 [Planctomycetota bacterium]|jgi:hypothetical protein
MAIQVLNGFAYGVNKLTLNAGDGLTAPRVLSASSLSASVVRVTYDLPMMVEVGLDPLSVTDFRAYTIVENLSGDPLTVIQVDQYSPTEFDLITDSQDGVVYDLTVDTTNVRSSTGVLLDPAFNTAQFSGQAYDYGTTPSNLYLFTATNPGIQDEVQDPGWEPSKTYSYREDESVTAEAGHGAAPVGPPEDAPTTRPHIEPYEPLVDLNMVEARLTNRARYFIARGMHDGTSIKPVRFVLGAGWENPRWGEPCKPSPDATEVAGEVFEGPVVSEQANDRTLVVRCEGEVAPIYQVQEVMVYAQIFNSPFPGESLKEIPFACATFPQWFHTTGQWFVARLVIPM